MNPSIRQSAFGKASLASAVLVVAIVAGSQGLRSFDPALTAYAAVSVLALFATVYRFSVWAERPPTAMYLRRGWECLRGIVRRRRMRRPHRRLSPATLASALWRRFVAQTFILRRSPYRWIMHLCLSGGCTLAFALTFPLVFGWVHFTSLPHDAEIYQMCVFGIAVDSFDVHSFKAFLVFNLLNFAAVAVLIGLVMAAGRRLRNAGERATQKFMEDWLPLLLIFAVTATGLMLTASYKLCEGAGHKLIAVVHMLSVFALILFIPFGKLFHMFQRITSLCVALHQKRGSDEGPAWCVRCGDDFATQLHVDDLKTVLDQLGFNYRFSTPHGEVHYQDICPACRRRMLALNQGRTLGR